VVAAVALSAAIGLAGASDAAAASRPSAITLIMELVHPKATLARFVAQCRIRRRRTNAGTCRSELITR